MEEEISEPLDEKDEHWLVDLVKNDPNELIKIFLISCIIVFLTTYLWTPSLVGGQISFCLMIIPSMIFVTYVLVRIEDRNWSDLIWDMVGVIGAITFYGILAYYGFY